MKRWGAAFVSLMIAGVSFGACAKGKHHAMEAEAKSADDQMQMMHIEPADRSQAQRGHVEPPVIPECVTPSEDMSPYADAPTEPWYEIQGAPDGTNALSHALRARGGKDLIRSDELQDIPNAEAQLRFLAAHGELSLERQRALSLLRNFPSEKTRALLMRLSEDADLHVSLRASALRSLLVVLEPDDEEGQSVIGRARKSDEPRIRKAVKGEELVEPTP